jgi:adenine-specific DNA-methyltransferase
MPKYTCERCLKEFSQKSHYTKHQNKKLPCQDNKGKIEEVVENIIINKKLILRNTENIITQTQNMDIDLQEFVKCDVFTPDDISKLMTSKLNNKGNILEPSVGTGNLLKYINLENYDFADLFEIKKEYLETIPYNKKLNIYNCDFIKQHIDTKYDNIIMNPPYIKTQDLSKDYRNYLKTNFNILKNGIIDIYYAFIIKCIDLLKTDGVLVSITPNSYLYNKSSLRMRKYLFDNKYVKEIIDFNDKKVFPGVSVYCCITIFTKTDKQFILYNNRKILYTDIIKNYSLFNTSSNNKLKLKDICKIRNGIATLRDKIYIHPTKLYDEPCWKKITNGNTEKFIIYPYKECIIIDEDIFSTENPLTYNYLLSQKVELSKRDKGNKKYPKWYSYGRTQSLKYSKNMCIYIPCFLNPDLINENIIIKNNILHSGCLCIEPNNEKDIQTIIKAIIKNREFIKLNSSKRSGGWINLSSRTLYDLEL